MEIIIELKFKKSYLAKLSFEKEMLGELWYKNLINNFAPQKQEKYI